MEIVETSLREIISPLSPVELLQAHQAESQYGTAAMMLGVASFNNTILNAGLEEPETGKEAAEKLVQLFPFLNDILGGEVTDEENILLLELFDRFTGYSVIFATKPEICQGIARNALRNPEKLRDAAKMSLDQYDIFLVSEQNRPLRVFLLIFHFLLGSALGKDIQQMNEELQQPIPGKK